MLSVPVARVIAVPSKVSITISLTSSRDSPLDRAPDCAKVSTIMAMRPGAQLVRPVLSLRQLSVKTFTLLERSNKACSSSCISSGTRELWAISVNPCPELMIIVGMTLLTGPEYKASISSIDTPPFIVTRCVFMSRSEDISSMTPWTAEVSVHRKRTSEARATSDGQAAMARSG
ncbi:MAG: hypothetical protein A4E31_00983 [Methanomassiliicoccales archaeon PtaU1.Bin030]|nr:MAG: hypothetical protein A4E31_00983 [Methanomassiliicoccales archaeon PtaU1.Bin030]